MKKALIIASLLMAVAAFLPADAAAQSSVTAKAQRITGDRFRYSLRTPAGASVIAVKRPSKQMLTAIDKGLNDLFAAAKRHNYRQKLRHSDYTIYIAKADRQTSASGVYTPDIAVGAAQYAGTAYDQGGFIYAAGMVISNNPLAFIIAEHTKDFNRVSDVVRYEGEHLVLYHNDRRKYSQTADHSKGGSHPILN